MDSSITNFDVSSESFASWQRSRSDEEIHGFISRRTDLLGELDDDDLELAMI